MAPLTVVQILHRAGGVAARRTLVAATSRAELDRAVAAGEVIRDGHGRYARPVAGQAVRAANALTGVVSHRTAALHWGWELKVLPELPDVTVRRNRVIAQERRVGVALHRADLTPREVDGTVTSRERTVVDCVRSLPFDEALAIADSALRHRGLTEDRLLELVPRP